MIDVDIDDKNDKITTKTNSLEHGIIYDVVLMLMLTLLLLLLMLSLLLLLLMLLLLIIPVAIAVAHVCAAVF